MRQLKLFSIAFFCLVVTLASAALLVQEMEVLLQPQKLAAVSSSHTASQDVRYSLSSYSKKLVLSDCSHALLLRRSSREEQEQLAKARSCEALSRSITASMPTHSQAWYVNALAQARLGNTDAFLWSYRRSRATGPNEQWIAENRARLAEEMFSHLDPGALKDHEADLTMLAYSQRGTSTLARRYASDQAFRNRIIEIVSRLPPERQRAFLSNVKRAIR